MSLFQSSVDEMTMWTTVDPTAELRERYRANGWWDDRALPALLHDALTSSSGQDLPRSLPKPAVQRDRRGRDDAGLGRLAAGLATPRHRGGRSGRVHPSQQRRSRRRVLRAGSARRDVGARRAHGRTARAQPRAARVRRPGTRRLEPARSALCFRRAGRAPTCRVLEHVVAIGDAAAPADGHRLRPR